MADMADGYAVSAQLQVLFHCVSDKQGLNPFLSSCCIIDHGIFISLTDSAGILTTTADFPIFNMLTVVYDFSCWIGRGFPSGICGKSSTVL